MAQHTPPAQGAEAPAGTPIGNAAEATAGGRLPRGSLDPDDIVEAAYRVANEVGLAKFSVPMVARHLGVGVTSLYWHFRKKEELLEAMAARATAQYRAATPFEGAEDWRAGLRRHFRRMHQTFVEEPVLIELMLLLQPRPPLDGGAVRATSDRLRHIVGEMVAAGFAEDDAVQVYFALLGHVCGAAMVDHQEVLVHARPLHAAVAGRRGETDSPEDAEADRAAHRAAEEAIFDFTFEAILDRAETLRAPHAASRSSSDSAG